MRGYSANPFGIRLSRFTRSGISNATRVRVAVRDTTLARGPVDKGVTALSRICRHRFRHRSWPKQLLAKGAWIAVRIRDATPVVMDREHTVREAAPRPKVKCVQGGREAAQNHFGDLSGLCTTDRQSEDLLS